MPFNTRQEAFDATVKHLAEQKQMAAYRSAVGTPKCQYKFYENESGKLLTCAVGCHIKDIPTAFMEGQGINYIYSINKYADETEKRAAIYDALNIVGGSEEESEDFWCHIQGVHDRAYTLVSLKKELYAFVAKRKLNPASIDLITEWKEWKMLA